MTAAKSTTRRRRISAGSVPTAMAEWFSGSPVLRRPMLFAKPHAWQVAELWRAWATQHRGATPPAGWEWLADPHDRRHRRPAWLATLEAG